MKLNAACGTGRAWDCCLGFHGGRVAAVNYATVNISGKLAPEIAISEPIEWTLVGIMVGLIYRPAVSAARRD